MSGTEQKKEKAPEILTFILEHPHLFLDAMYHFLSHKDWDNLDDALWGQLNEGLMDSEVWESIDTGKSQLAFMLFFSRGAI